MSEPAPLVAVGGSLVRRSCLLSWFIAVLASLSPVVTESAPSVADSQRRGEKLDRGLIARSLGEGRVYLSWRLLQSDPENVAFHVYRRMSTGRNASRVSNQPVRTTTDFIDTTADGEAFYSVRPLIGAREGAAGAEVKANGTLPSSDYTAIKLAGQHTFQKLALADLNGDGRYDYVLKTPNQNVDPYMVYWKKSPGTYQLQAYDADGKPLWVHDLGWSIEQGIWYSPYVVYDFNGDGRAEVALKAGEGDPRDEDGRVQSGAEYLLILDGLTGREIVRTAWPSREGFEDYNRYCRNQLGIAYLDGKTPSLLVQRGTYSLIKLHAYNLRGGKLQEVWQWKSTDETPSYNGQGAHCLRAGDIDGDGRDEVILGSAVIDDNGRGLWTTRLGHPDHVYIGDLDPARAGLEIYYGIESRQKQNGMCMVDAATGKILWGLNRPTRHVHGQGLVADFDAGHPGCETYSADTDEQKKLAWVLVHNAQGEVIAQEDLGGFAPKAAYWDADTQRELIRGRKLQKFKGQEYAIKLEGSVIGVADIYGDWREEIVTTLPGELRIYCTLIPATDRRVCLMQDPFYRADVSTASQGYYQIPTPKILPGTETTPARRDTQSRADLPLRTR